MLYSNIWLTAKNLRTTLRSILSMFMDFSSLGFNCSVKKENSNKVGIFRYVILLFFSGKKNITGRFGHIMDYTGELDE